MKISVAAWVSEGEGYLKRQLTNVLLKVCKVQGQIIGGEGQIIGGEGQICEGPLQCSIVLAQNYGQPYEYECWEEVDSILLGLYFRLMYKFCLFSTSLVYRPMQAISAAHMNTLVVEKIIKRYCYKHSIHYENPLFATDTKRTYGSKGWAADEQGDDDFFTEDDKKFFEK